MKKSNRIICTLILIGISIQLFADDNVAPPKNKFDKNTKITKTGSIIGFNGRPPNLRMIIINNNEIIGIGITENDIDINCPKEILGYIREQKEIIATVTLQYISSVKIGYYEDPLPCFKIIKILKLKIRSEGNKEWISIK
jgi:hypothetical protein